MIPAQSLIPDALAEVLRHAPLTPEKVSFAWRTAVGATIGRVTTARLGDAGVLHVAVTDARWRPAIAKGASLIRTRLAALLGPDIVTRIELTASKP